jgi:transcription initiation factor TFIID subunit 1
MGFSLGLGLGGVLQEAGVDVAAFSSFFGASEAGPSGTSGKGADGAARLAEIEGEGENEGKYMDDDDDTGISGLAGVVGEGEDAEQERMARQKAKAREKAEQEEWMAKGLQIQREAESRAAAMAAKRRKLYSGGADGHGGVKEETPLDIVRRMWPGWQVGNRLRMSQVFYQTPVMEEKELQEGAKRKRRHFGHELGSPDEEAEDPIPEPRKCTSALYLL